MNSIKKKLTAIENQLVVNEKLKKYEGCIFEMEIATEEEPGGYFVLHPDGHREQIEGKLFEELTVNDTVFDVEIRE